MRRPNPDVPPLQATYKTRPGTLAVLVSASADLLHRTIGAKGHYGH
jgi:hypothetical protein